MVAAARLEIEHRKARAVHSPVPFQARIRMLKTRFVTICD